MLVDTHSHLYWESFRDDFDQMIQRTKQAGVGLIINVGVDIEKSQAALKQVETQLDQVPDLKAYSTIGIHPHEATKYFDDESIHEDIKKLEEIWKSNPEKVIGIGECGLDFLFESNPDFLPSSATSDEAKQSQIKLLQAQIDLAIRLDLPLIVHVRDDRSKNPNNSECWDKALEMIKNHFGILHCYSGLEETTRKALDTDFLISFAATLTYPKNDYLRQAAKDIPLDRIVLETDCPFLPPQSKRGQRNEPETILEIAQTIADLRGIPFDYVASQTTDNVKRLFKI